MHQRVRPFTAKANTVPMIAERNGLYLQKGAGPCRWEVGKKGGRKCDRPASTDRQSGASTSTGREPKRPALRPRGMRPLEAAPSGSLPSSFGSGGCAASNGLLPPQSVARLMRVEAHAGAFHFALDLAGSYRAAADDARPAGPPLGLGHAASDGAQAALG